MSNRPEFLGPSNKRCASPPPMHITVWDGPTDEPQILRPTPRAEEAEAVEVPAPARAGSGGTSTITNVALCAAAVYAVMRFSDPAPAPLAAVPPLPPEAKKMIIEATSTAMRMQERWGVPAQVLLADAVLCNNWKNANDYFRRSRGYKSAWAAFNEHARLISEKIKTECDDMECFLAAAKNANLLTQTGERDLMAVLPSVEAAMKSESKP